jgi:hypothetical protein
MIPPSSIDLLITYVHFLYVQLGFFFLIPENIDEIWEEFLWDI